MTRKLVLAVAALAVLGISCAQADEPGRVRVRKVAAVAPAPDPVLYRDCSAFYPKFLGFGLLSGALPRYSRNEFPNWYGECLTWGHYQASGTAFW